MHTAHHIRFKIKSEYCYLINNNFSVNKTLLLFLLVIDICLPFRWELVGSVSHCRAGAGVAVCSSHVSQIRDVGQGSSNVANCM